MCLYIISSIFCLNSALGFYTLDPSSPENTLILGPFQGKVACQTISFDRGVCGAAASTKSTQLVPDVEQFPGHIACDADSQRFVIIDTFSIYPVSLLPTFPTPPLVAFPPRVLCEGVGEEILRYKELR
ncbi:hypothetical protein ACMFMG_011878 [Clarireedia jacksonii]